MGNMANTVANRAEVVQVSTLHSAGLTRTEPAILVGQARQLMKEQEEVKVRPAKDRLEEIERSLTSKSDANAQKGDRSKEVPRIPCTPCMQRRVKGMMNARTATNMTPREVT